MALCRRYDVDTGNRLLGTGYSTYFRPNRKKLLLVRHKLFSITDKAIIPMDDKTYAAGKTLLTVCGQIYRIGGGPLISSTFKRDSYKLVSALNDGSGEYFVCTEDACTFLDSNCKIVGDVIFTSLIHIQMNPE